MNLGLFVVKGHHQGTIRLKNVPWKLKNWNIWSFIAWATIRHLNKEKDRLTHIDILKEL